MKGLAQTAYAVWCEENTTLYFTYRSETLTAGGTFTPEDGSGTKTITNVWSGTDVMATDPQCISWWSTSCKTTLTTVVFERGFNNVHPTSMGYWFYDCQKLETFIGLQYLNTDEATTMAYMFDNCNKLTSLDLTGFNTSKVTTMNSMFSYCKSLENLDCSSFDTRNVTDMSYMFYNCVSLDNLDSNNFDTSHVEILAYTFFGCQALKKLDLTGWNTENVENMQGMFNQCSRLTSLDISSFHTSNVINMYEMFTNCIYLSTIYVGDDWTTNNVTSINNVSYSTNMFKGCTSLVGGNGTLYNASYVDKTYAKADGYPTSSTKGYLTYKKYFVPIYEQDDNSRILEAKDGIICNMTVNRTIYQDNGWNTLCLPFTLTASDITTTFGNGTKVMKLTGDSYDAAEKVLSLNFTDVASEGMEAGMPYLIKTGTTGDPLTSLSFTDKTITKTAGEWTGTNVILHGVLSPTQVVTESSDVSHVLFIGENGKFYTPAAYDSSVENSGKMKGMRAYFTVSDDVSYTRARATGLGDEADAIELRVVDLLEDDTPYYTLQGIRVDNPTHGVYIKNGKKVFIK